MENGTESMARVAARAPGRINLIGDHTDYTGGLCFPMAIDRHVAITGTRSRTPQVRLVSDREQDVALVPLDVDNPADAQPPWARYVAAVIAELRPSFGFHGAIRSDVPIGMGLSSSAALEVAVALALGAPGDDPVAVARLCQAAEHAARGVPTGILDQLSSLCGVAGHGLLLDCHSLAVTPIALPPPDEIEWVVVHPREARSLEQSGYADRVRELAAAEMVLGPLRLADDPGDADDVDDPTIRARARHVISENRRVREFARAITSGDLRGAGVLMDESHASLSADFESSTVTIDRLCRELREHDGVLGTRITGGGWGGCVIALSRPGALAEFPGAETVRPSGGASVEIDGIVGTGQSGG